MDGYTPKKRSRTFAYLILIVLLTVSCALPSLPTQAPEPTPTILCSRNPCPRFLRKFRQLTEANWG